ncbi:hypothetical protein [Bordetella genomosp. 4]|uniref:Uncharacterized protein n=1 Tax=Bordetella genomosp. 4 TaxID=463044 RepID=A0A261U678_9BORD|nr:hypothetical protein [Bordetella genomosp. 4]OZI57434.1 hypothetical protein CAL20_08540 [Bordetella genomosp. 4]
MSGDNSPRFKRYALKITLIYLLIRGLPELLFFVFYLLPEATVQSLVQTQSVWLRHLYPVLPLQVLTLPLGFQYALALVPVLIIECLLVFLFSAWFIRRRPWAAERPSNKGRWIILVLATLAWSYFVRLQILGHFQHLWVEELQTLEAKGGDWFELMPPILLQANRTITSLLYTTMPLWAWVPVWLHFLFAKKPVDTTHDTAFADSNHSASVVAPLQKSIAFTSFLLGCLGLHFVLVLLTYLGLWPWAAQLSDIQPPLDVLDALSLPLSLSQIVFASLICLLAATIYVRRLTIARPNTFGLVIKPLLSGVIAYLLTSFLILALVWAWMWLNPGFVESLPRQLSRNPESGLALAIALNLVAMALLCIASGRLRQSPRRWTGVLAVLMLCASIPLYVGWTLASANMGAAGGTPGMAVTGKLGDARWRSMEQWCTGVVETRHGTWLVGRNEDSSGAAPSYIPDGVQDLSKLVMSEDEAASQRRFSLFNSRSVLTTLSLLQDDGTFKMVATVPDVTCLVVSPKSDTLFLFTGIDRPRPSSPSLPANEQTAVFRSTDHGATWTLLESGFMTEVDGLAWNIKPTFSSDQEVWAWGKEPPSDDEPTGIWGRPEPASTRRDANGNETRPTALFYSSDQGQTSAVVYSPEPLIAPVSYLREMIGQPTADFSSRRDMDQERFVVQVSDTRAYAWASEFMWYSVGEAQHRTMLMTRAELSRTTSSGEWQITKVTRHPELRVQHLSTSLDGRTYAILQDKDGEWLAKLDTQTGEWIERQKTPSLLPQWLAEDRTSARYFWNNGDYQVVSEWGDTVVPRLIIPVSKDRAEIDTDAHFYTRDGGRTWHQLAIPGYLGVMGLSPAGSKLYWSKGDWYENDEPLQWQYDLAR